MKAAKGRSHSPESHGGATSQELKRGAKVLILNNDNVSQRAPQYIGQVGTVKDVPVHPATWFKIQFADGQIMTFRPTALEVLSDEDDSTPPRTQVATATPVKRARDDAPGEKDAGDEKKKKKSLPGNRSETDSPDPSVASTTSASIFPANGNGVNGSQVLLSSTDPDTWINKVVSVRVGKDEGLTGRILRSGNGWVQIATGTGEIAKRAYDLYIVGGADPSAYPEVPNGSFKQQTLKPKRNMKSDGSVFIDARPSNGRRGSGDDETTETTVASADPTSAGTKEDIDKPRQRTRSYSDSFNNYVAPCQPETVDNIPESDHVGDQVTEASPTPDTDINLEVTGIALANLSNVVSGTRSRGARADVVDDYLRPFAKPRSADAPRPVNRVASSNAKPKGRSSSNNANGRNNIVAQRGLNAMQAAQPVDTSSLPSNGPKISTQAVALKRVLTQKFIDRCSEKLKDRPDLGYWASLVRGGMVDREFELSVAVDPLKLSCSYCKVENWPGAQFCWNEYCPSSPIFYRLKGARGSLPPSPKPRSTAICPQLEARCKYFSVHNGELSYSFNGEETDTVLSEHPEIKMEVGDCVAKDITKGGAGVCSENPVNMFLWDAPKVSVQYDCFLNVRKS
jgi:hypothetical protein